MIVEVELKTGAEVMLVMEGKLSVVLPPPISPLGIMPNEIRLLGCGVVNREPDAAAGVRIGLAKVWVAVGSRPFRDGFGVANG